MLTSHPINPIYRFFRTEYKNEFDAIAAYNSFLQIQEDHRAEQRKLFFKKLWKSFCNLFVIKGEKQRYEEYLAMSTSLEDLERRQKIWDTYLSHKRTGAYI